MAAPQVIGRDGRPIVLGKLLGKGGEGAVYEVAGAPTVVAKIYLAAISPMRADKLNAMQAMVTPALKALTAWPTELVHLPDGRVGGFLMPNMRGSKDIHTLYSPKSRQAEFPEADWRMLVRAALNTARAFAALHGAGCLVGDVNHGGVRVSPDATVRLIDCDSFQISRAGRTFLCEVGVDNFTPPELQGKSFKVTPRTTNHDNFGLAVLVFQMLLMGRHPYAGRYAGKGDMPISKAISEFRYAYGALASSAGMQPPPNTAPVMSASPTIAALWERAFGRQGVQQGVRPTAMEWVTALSALEQSFARCGVNPSHYYFAGHGKCPWCPIEKIGVTLFPLTAGAIAALAKSGTFHLQNAWSQIVAITAPPPSAQWAMPSPQDYIPSPEAVAAKVRQVKWRIGGIVAGLALMVFGMILNSRLWFPWALVATWAGIWVSRNDDNGIQEQLRDRFQVTKASFVDLSSRLARDASPALFSTKMAHLNGLKTEWLNLPATRQQRFDELMANRREVALHQFLDRFELERAQVTGIGPQKKAMLESYGIETAADIDPKAIMQVPGFGPELTTRLTVWRRGLEMQFRFDPKSAVDPRHVSELDRDIVLRRNAIEAELRLAPAQLKGLKSAILARRATLEPLLQRASEELGQAMADVGAAG